MNSLNQIRTPPFSVPLRRDNFRWSEMRIGKLCHPTCGGSGRVACNLVNAFTQMGIQSDFLGDRSPFFAQGTDTGAEVDRSNDSSQNELKWYWTEDETQKFALQVAEQIRSSGINVLHFHYAAPYAHIAHLVKQIMNGEAPAIVGTLHGTDVTQFKTSPKARNSLASSLGSANILTTVSQSHSILAQSIFELDNPPIVIPNPINLSKFHPGNASRINTASRPRMLHVSNFRKVKNPIGVAEVFIRARRHLDLELCLVGEGKELPAVLQQLNDAGVGEDVVTHGAITDVENIIRKSDLLLMTSNEESFGLALLEGMACGIPVLSTDVGGVREVVRHGRNGFLFESGDWDTAARYAVEILNNPNISGPMREAGPIDAKNYAMDKIAVRYLELYSHCLNNRLQIEANG